MLCSHATLQAWVNSPLLWWPRKRGWGMKAARTELMHISGYNLRVIWVRKKVRRKDGKWCHVRCYHGATLLCWGTNGHLLRYVKAALNSPLGGKGKANILVSFFPDSASHWLKLTSHGMHPPVFLVASPRPFSISLRSQIHTSGMLSYPSSEVAWGDWPPAS